MAKADPLIELIKQQREQQKSLESKSKVNKKNRNCLSKQSQHIKHTGRSDKGKQTKINHQQQLIEVKKKSQFMKNKCIFESQINSQQLNNRKKSNVVDDIKIQNIKFSQSQKCRQNVSIKQSFFNNKKHSLRSQFETNFPTIEQDFVKTKKQNQCLKNSRKNCQTYTDQILSTHQIVPQHFYLYVQKISEQNILYEQKLKKLIKQLNQKDILLNDCQKQIYHLKKLYEMYFQRPQEMIVAKSKQEKVIQSSSNANNLQYEKVNQKEQVNINVKAKQKQIIHNLNVQNQNKNRRIEYSESTIFLDNNQSHQNINQPNNVMIEQSSFEISNSFICQIPSKQAHPFTQSFIQQNSLRQSQPDNNINQKLKADQSDLMIKAKNQIQSTRKDINILRQRIQNVTSNRNLKSNSLNTSKQNLLKHSAKHSNAKQQFKTNKNKQNTINIIKIISSSQPLKQNLEIFNILSQKNSSVLPVHRLALISSKKKL